MVKAFMSQKLLKLYWKKDKGKSIYLKARLTSKKYFKNRQYIFLIIVFLKKVITIDKLGVIISNEKQCETS